jgi:hypothetical protein
MPNWCANSTTFKHEDPEQITRMKTAFLEDKLFTEFAPAPTDLGEYWYHWCIENWGTKWDVNGSDDGVVDLKENEITLYFDTAWSPPLEFYIALEDLGFTVEGYYYEPGMNFVGKWDENGDDCYEIPETVEAIEEKIPSDIEQCFNLIENLIQWQEENQDES